MTNEESTAVEKPRDRITFTNKSTLNSITICRDEDNLYVGDDRYQLPDRQVRDFIWSIAYTYPNTLTYENALGGSDAQAADVQKVAHRFKRFISSVRSGHDLVRNIRSVGYSIYEAWELERERLPGSANDRLMEWLNELIDRSIKHMRESKIESDPSGVSYIRPRPEYSAQIFKEIDSLYWEILAHTSHTSNSLEIIELRDPLFQLMTYVLFWRVGDRLQESQWREDYEIEIMRLAKRIEFTYKGS